MTSTATTPLLGHDAGSAGMVRRGVLHSLAGDCAPLPAIDTFVEHPGMAVSNSCKHPEGRANSS